jgi:hypothetical protein
MKITVIKKGNKNAKPVNYCGMFVDEVPMNKK